MANYIYMRCSTDGQDYAQQRNTIDVRLAILRIDESEITEEVCEKISGTVNHTERKLAQLLDKCSEGDTIYVSELSRLGRNMSDLFAIVTDCCDRGVILIQCKDGSTIENKTIGGKALLFALSLAAEIEVQNIRQRTQAGIDVVKRNIEERGYHVAKSGRTITHLGREKGCKNVRGPQASALSKSNQSAQWFNNSPAVKWVSQQLAKGKQRKVIIEEFNELHKIQPQTYCTRDGKPLSEAILSHWVKKLSSAIA